MSKDAAVWLFAGLLCCLVPVAAYADSGAPVPVHVGTHPGYGRVVFNLPERLDYSLTQQGQHVLVRFTGDVTIGSAPSVPHNVLGLTGGAGQAELVVETGTVVRAWRLGDLVVVDVLDKAFAASAAPVQPSVATPSPGTAGHPAPGTSTAGPAAPVASAPVSTETGRKSAAPSSPAPPPTSVEKQADAPVAAKPAPDAQRPPDPPSAQPADLPAPTPLPPSTCRLATQTRSPKAEHPPRWPPA